MTLKQAVLRCMFCKAQWAAVYPAEGGYLPCPYCMRLAIAPVGEWITGICGKCNKPIDDHDWIVDSPVCVKVSS